MPTTKDLGETQELWDGWSRPEPLAGTGWQASLHEAFLVVTKAALSSCKECFIVLPGSVGLSVAGKNLQEARQIGLGNVRCARFFNHEPYATGMTKVLFLVAAIFAPRIAGL